MCNRGEQHLDSALGGPKQSFPCVLHADAPQVELIFSLLL